MLIEKALNGRFYRGYELASGSNSNNYGAITGGDIVAGAGLVTIGHQVLFINGSLKLMLKIPPESVKGLSDFPVCEENVGPVVYRVVDHTILAATMGVKTTLIASPPAKL